MKQVECFAGLFLVSQHLTALNASFICLNIVYCGSFSANIVNSELGAAVDCRDHSLLYSPMGNFAATAEQFCKDKQPFMDFKFSGF